ncbi:DUF3325 domain-containing protein [Oceanibaculum indicum]|uniref:Uncharacterized protein DUF3325 n=1 Tax=Oceanibaculum indicum TaxID=526216 RepID=A0A420WHN0_9PROT|nr:DUF3325 domain-containing protein [Oceanibaculum indicum]RKQ70503.1 uncharacterized protein DUF3325 [Oceanibaculum indicum]
MPESILLALILGTSYLGFNLLALSQEKNWERVTGQRHVPGGRTLPLRLAGYGLLALALALSLERDGASFGSILWVVGLSVGGLATVATLTWRPAWLKPLARIATAGRSRRQSA